MLVCLAAALVALAVGACGSSSGGGNAQTLLQQTFTGTHRVNSGVLDMSLTVVPRGSSELRTPITLDFSGPFQSRGAGRAPASDFTISLSAQGHSGSLSIISTGTAGYVTVGGRSFRLPAATFKRLEHSFKTAQGAAGGAPGSDGRSSLEKLGIDPMNWLVGPTTLGRAQIGGTETTHVHAHVDVEQMLSDLSKLLQSHSFAVSGHSKLPHGIPQSTQLKLAKALGSPTFDLWTADGDKTMRQLVLGLTVAPSGHVATELGALRSVHVTLKLRYTDLNRPQTITAPTQLAPYALFQTEVQALLGQLAGGLGGGLGSALSGAYGPGGSPQQRYERCIQKAGGSVARMQKCTAVLSPA